MSAPETTPVAPAEKITVDDLKARAEKVKDLAISDTKRVASDVLETNAARTLLMAAGIVVIAASIAFYLGNSTRPVPRRPV